MNPKENRSCGTCSLCCTLLPVAEINKLANERCKHQDHIGCRVYNNRPRSCHAWSCRWLMNQAGETSRPNKVHYVIDVVPDHVEVQDTETLDGVRTEVIQVWCDPKYPKAYNDKKLREFLNKVKKIGLIRFNAVDSIAIIPPSVSGKDRWMEITGNLK